jgi:diacylglycerol kinase (ATP)
MQRTVIIPNRVAGRGNAVRASTRLRDLLHAQGGTVEVCEPDSAESARSLVRGAVSEGVGCVVIAGGDGSLQNIFDLVADTDTVLAAIPTGRGNDLVRGLSMPLSCEKLAKSILEERSRRVDLGCVNRKLYGTIACCGLDAEVGRLTAGGSDFGGMTGYLIQALKSIRSFCGYAVRIEVDGRVLADGEMTLVACANTATYGGGLCVAPGADPADGRLDICIVRRVSRFKALGLLPQMAIGEHPGHPEVSFHSGYEIRIETPDPLHALADGEVIGQTPLEVSTKHQVLRVVH